MFLLYSLLVIVLGRYADNVSRFFRTLALHSDTGFREGITSFWVSVAGGQLAAGDAYHRIRTRSRCFFSILTQGGMGGGGVVFSNMHYTIFLMHHTFSNPLHHNFSNALYIF